ncbi:MAG: hypothetical protein AB1638_10340, partial [Nitrospirota bacterium]
GYSYFPVTDRFNFTPVQGAKDTMYWASHNTTSSMRIYRWQEDSGTIYWNDVTIPAWTSTPRGSALCPTAEGYNPCARLDDRILSGWISNWDGYPGEPVLGFFWNVQEGGGFAMPYVNSAVFKERDRTYLARPYIWNASWAWIYAAGAPNARGDLGVSLTHVPNGGYPNHSVLINDDVNGAPPGWEGYWVVSSGSAGPSDNKWGDYHRVRPHFPAGLQWTATGWVLNASGTSLPKYVIFGRERDNKSLNRWILN